jgi:hypothetical protein
LFGCYSFTNRVLDHHLDVPPGFAAPSVLEARRAELTGSSQDGAAVTFAKGCEVDDDDCTGLDVAVACGQDTDVAILVVGDQARLFGRGKVGEGCDRDNLELPGVPRACRGDPGDRHPTWCSCSLPAARTPRPALDQCAVILAFVPGEEGAAAIAGVISGRVNPSGRLPVTLPQLAGAQPYSHLHPPLGGATTVSNLPTAPALPFRARVVLHNVRAQGRGHGGKRGGGRRLRGDDAGGQHRPSCGVRGRPADQHDVVASISRPTAQLLGYTRLALEPGESAVVRFVVLTTRLAFSDRDLVRVVEPGDVEPLVHPNTHGLGTERGHGM